MAEHKVGIRVQQGDQGDAAAPSRGRLCHGCGNPFQLTRRGQRYCRPSCRDLAEQRRQGVRLPLEDIQTRES